MTPSTRTLNSLLAVVLFWLIRGPLAAAAPEAASVVVDRPVVLYDGKTTNDLSKFYTWLKPHGYRDPNRVFTIADRIDGAPAIRISGEDWGGIVTREQYNRYKLVAKFRWGTVSWGIRKAMARNSGVLIHCQGEVGNHEPTFTSPWIISIEYEILEGRTGDVILVPGYVTRSGAERFLPRATMRAQLGSAYWDPQAPPREFVAGQKPLHWFAKDTDWKDVLGFRGRKDVEKPSGEWNLVEATVDGGDLTYYLNGVKVMEVTNCTLTHGRLLFQAEGSEIFFVASNCILSGGAVCTRAPP